MSTTIHDTDTCNCEQCHWADAQESAIATDIDTVLSSLAPTPTFERDWASAPREARNYVEYAVAQYWWWKGRRVEQTVMATATNIDLREMVRVARERLR